ncbi:MAG: hypothetical protein JW832_06650 [Deltaproteobacteria bacterium]|nr:hypothetical protein [Deltaproteobacteria bacterium]
MLVKKEIPGWALALLIGLLAGMLYSFFITKWKYEAIIKTPARVEYHHFDKLPV